VICGEYPLDYQRKNNESKFLGKQNPGAKKRIPHTLVQFGVHIFSNDTITQVVYVAF
jgi:hypothetical protein